MEEKIFYDSDKNIKLCGILNKSNKDKIVIMCHGIRGNKEECGSFTYLAEKLHEEGYSSFRFDFNGHGESSGEDFEMTISKEITDLKNTINMFFTLFIVIISFPLHIYKLLYNIHYYYLYPF